MKLHLIHNWSKWELIEDGVIKNTDTKAKVGSFFVQQRKCKICDFIEQERDNSYL